MKVVAKPIDMVCWIDKDGHINPVRFRLDNEDSESTVIRINRVVTRDREKLAGNHMLVFNCQGCINGLQKPFEIKYELNTCKWMLFKI